ncbi:hypothetical protein [Comamonas sp. JUb58]|uniref:hypothetical protein n=1 Tax=Comamonas sp. JUb58 TaxID=2485114 RepID=UPI0010616CF9|nr:hypothetical protein [Comamonas sp. JUb58]TDS73433.1 hypothetical protein EDF71_121107 [Comamonas sp. JUb58]
MHQVPEAPHELALWLLDKLEGLENVGGSARAGTLPIKYDFQAVVSNLEHAGSLGGVCNDLNRNIEFYPTSVGVYETLAEFFSHSGNLRSVPNKFSIRDLGYTSDPNSPPPDKIQHYLSAAKLSSLISEVSDHAANTGNSQYFIKSHDAKLEILMEYSAEDIRNLPSLAAFEDDFIRSAHHQDQKRNIIRSTLLDLFKNKRRITFGEFLPYFEEFVQNARSSYAMYTADFSYEKIRTEVEKQNLEDTVRLNKTVSEIQNQLLALPAALILAGAGIDEKSIMKSVAIWVGITIFSWIMWKLINNQNHSVNAINKEISIRKERLGAQPEAVASRFSETFTDLECRVIEQTAVLNGIRWVVGVIWLVVSFMLFTVVFPEYSENLKDFMAALPNNLINMGEK